MPEVHHQPLLILYGFQAGSQLLAPTPEDPVGIRPVSDAIGPLQTDVIARAGPIDNPGQNVSGSGVQEFKIECHFT